MTATTQDEATRMFSEWYEYCLEKGIEPESIVENYGEMKLITDIDIIEKIDSLLNE
jgi:hypothetical protein